MTLYYLNNVSEHEVLGAQGELLALSDDGGELGHHVLEGLHDLGALALLVVGEDTGHDDHGGQHNTEVEIVIGGLFNCARLGNNKTQLDIKLYCILYNPTVT